MPPPKTKKLRTVYDPEEEARLERLVFADAKDVINKLLDNAPTASVKSEDSEDENTEYVDSNKADSDEESTSIKSEDEESDAVESTVDNSHEDQDESDEKVKPAWVDDDDNYTIDEAVAAQQRKLPRGRPEKNYKELLEKKFTALVGTPKWSELNKPEEADQSDSDSEILKRSNHLAKPKQKKLPKGTIDIKALKQINASTHIEGNILNSLQFHPTSTVAFVAGLKGILSVFQIDGRENAKLQTINFDNFRINAAKFLKNGDEIILGSRTRRYSQVYNLMTGKIYKNPLPHCVTNMQKFEVSPDGKLIAVIGRVGEIHLLTASSKELIQTFKMNNKCNTVAFTADNKTLITHGDSEEIYTWDLHSRTCLNKAVDDGCLSSSAVATSPSGQFLATGSKQGVVNIYDLNSVRENRFPNPLKIILNLVTPITSLKFNATTEILTMASEFKENAFKLVHLPSFTVFSNFPTFQTVMHNPLAIDFSPASGFLGISNNHGDAYLYRLKHYGNY